MGSNGISNKTKTIYSMFVVTLMDGYDFSGEVDKAAVLYGKA